VRHDRCPLLSHRNSTLQEYKLFTMIYTLLDTMTHCHCWLLWHTVVVGYLLTIVDIITNLIFWLTLPTYMHLNSVLHCEPTNLFALPTKSVAAAVTKSEDLTVSCRILNSPEVELESCPQRSRSGEAIWQLMAPRRCFIAADKSELCVLMPTISHPGVIQRNADLRHTDTRGWCRGSIFLVKLVTSLKS
jgi:hypothetical protein